MANRVALVRLLPYQWRMPTKDIGKPESLPVPPTCFRSLLLHFLDRHLLGFADHDLGPALQRLRSPAVLFQLPAHLHLGPGPLFGSVALERLVDRLLVLLE